MAGNFVRSALLTGSAGLIRELGGDPLAIARDAGLPAEAIGDPDILLPGRVAYDFLEQAAAACRCPSFGLRLGSRAHLAAVVGPLWLLLRGARTVREMLEDLAANFDIYTSVASVSIERLASGMVLSWSAAAGQAASEVQMADFAMAIFCQEIRVRCPPGWHPEAVEFRHAAPADLADYRRLFGTTPRFNADRNAVVIDAETAAIGLSAADSRRRNLAGALLRQEYGDPGIAERVESVVRGMLPFGPCGVAETARALGMSVRSLQRQLDQNGQSFRAVKDRVRADLARKYVLHSRLSLAEIGEILGYAELSIFSHAFRRWHGVAARDLRRGATSASIVVGPSREPPDST